MLTNVVVLGLCQFLLPALISGRTPNPNLMFGPFGSLFFANIPLFTVPETDAPSSPIAAFFLLFAGVWILATAIPGVTVLVRRLHDSNLSGLWVIVVLLPFGTLLLLALALRRPRPAGDRFDG